MRALTVCIAAASLALMLMPSTGFLIAEGLTASVTITTPTSTPSPTWGDSFLLTWLLLLAVTGLSFMIRNRRLRYRER